MSHGAPSRPDPTRTGVTQVSHLTVVAGDRDGRTDQTIDEQEVDAVARTATLASRMTLRPTADGEREPRHPDDDERDRVRRHRGGGSPHGDEDAPAHGPHRKPECTRRLDDAVHRLERACATHMRDERELGGLRDRDPRAQHGGEEEERRERAHQPERERDTSLPRRHRDEEPTRVTFTIEPHADIVRLTVIHEGFPTTEDREAAVLGWASVCANLKTLLETGDVMPQAPWEMHAELRAAQMARNDPR